MRKAEGADRFAECTYSAKLVRCYQGDVRMERFAFFLGLLGLAISIFTSDRYPKIAAGQRSLAYCGVSGSSSAPIETPWPFSFGQLPAITRWQWSLGDGL